MFFVNVGYRFALDPSVTPDGGLILCSAMPRHQLERRKLRRYPYLEQRLFDLQLYLSGLDATRATDHCAKLATYPWFGVADLPAFDSGQHRQSQWMETARQRIRRIWPGTLPGDPQAIEAGVRECIDFQVRLDTWAVILPSPLTVDFTSDYSAELEWLDAGLRHLEFLEGVDAPIYATVAISDRALVFADPSKNPILGLLLDQVSAREVNGIYLVLEQSGEDPNARQCGSSRTLRSLLYLVHRFANDCNLQVGVNFVGAFALACRAAGASWWASNWYKSLHRLRLGDTVAGGAVYPLYWSQPSALDVNLEADFDALAKADLSRIADPTPACGGLLAAAAQGVASNTLPDWRYAKSNATAAITHFLQSAVQMDARLTALGVGTAQLAHVEAWLRDAEATAAWAGTTLPAGAKTRLSHVSEWFEAFSGYRLSHKV